MALVFIPTLMRDLTGGLRQVEVAGDNLEALLDNLEARFPGFKERVFDEHGALAIHVAVMVDGDAIQGGAVLRAVPVRPTSEIHFVPPIGGGQGRSATHGRPRCYGTSRRWARGRPPLGGMSAITLPVRGP